jgi:hypothetical protein
MALLPLSERTVPTIQPRGASSSDSTRVVESIILFPNYLGIDFHEVVINRMRIDP